MKRDYYKGQDFWNRNPKFKRLEYPITDEIIKKAEDFLSVKLPQSFIDLMKIQNGGELNYPYFLLPNGDTEILHDIESIHFEKDDSSILSSIECLTMVDGLSKEFIVLWTDFHYWLVLDYRDKKDHPTVVYIAEDFSNYGTWEYFKIADTFDEFLVKLFR